MPHIENSGPRFRFFLDVEVEVVNIEKFQSAQLRVASPDGGETLQVQRIQAPNEWSVPQVFSNVIDHEALVSLGLQFRGSSIMPRMIDDNGNWGPAEFLGLPLGPKSVD